MPWLGHAPDAPDTHKIWADAGSQLEASLCASGWRHEVPAPGLEPTPEPPAEEPADQPPVVENTAPEPMLVKSKGQGRAAVDRKP